MDFVKPPGTTKISIRYFEIIIFALSIKKIDLE